MPHQFHKGYRRRGGGDLKGGGRCSGREACLIAGLAAAGPPSMDRLWNSTAHATMKVCPASNPFTPVTTADDGRAKGNPAQPSFQTPGRWSTRSPMPRLPSFCGGSWNGNRQETLLLSPSPHPRSVCLIAHANMNSDSLDGLWDKKAVCQKQWQDH